MRIYPAIDIKNGQCVRLKQGRFDDMTVYGSDPVAMAKKFVSMGASYLHIVDLDGARMGAGYNSGIISRIIESCKIPVQTGGGIRTMRDIEDRISIKSYTRHGSHKQSGNHKRGGKGLRR